ncbi:MAG: hypothetical protein IKU34_08435 [Clostridia bacterium]|nr:hypothetical protein [Clostridia bacterium]
MAIKNPVIRFALRIAAWLLILTGGLFGISSVICAVATVAGALEISSFGEGAAVFVILLAMAAANIFIMYGGIRLNRFACGKKAKKQTAQMKQVGASMTVMQEKPQPTADQKRLQDIEESIYYLKGAIEANPMFGGAGEYEKRIASLNEEKRNLLRKMAGDPAQLTIQDAVNTFLPEEQARFEEQIDQYSQDIQRGGAMPGEESALNRGLVLIEGRPVPLKVIRRLKEMREAFVKEEITSGDERTDRELRRKTDTVLWSVGKIIYDEPDNPYETVKVYLALGAEHMAVKSCIAEHGIGGGQSWRGVFLDADNLQKLRNIVGEDIEAFLSVYLRKYRNMGLIAFEKFLDQHAIAYESKHAF